MDKEEIDGMFNTKESTVETFKKDMLHHVDRRNALLK